MKHFLKLAEGVDVLPILLELQRAPELWGANPYRKNADGTPHSEMTDIWVRWARHEEDYGRAHYPAWYPAYHRLPSIRPIIFDLMARVQAVHLGGVLITRIPPGGKIEPHADAGWHPETMNCKCYLILKSNPDCTFRVEDEVVRMAHGDVWQIDNTKEHEIVNDGATERMTLIVCMRCET